MIAGESAVVEFAGAPGTGKSLLARSLVARLRKDGIAAHDLSFPAGGGRARPARLGRKAVGVAAGILGAPVISSRLLLATRRAVPRPRETVARVVNLVALRTLIGRAGRKDGVHVLDQGLVQELASIAHTGDPAGPLALVTSGRVVGPDLVVVVTAPGEVLADRLRERPGRQSRLEEAAPEQLEAAQATVSDLAGQLVRRCGPATRSLVVHNPGDGGIDQETVDELVAAVRLSSRSTTIRR